MPVAAVAIVAIVSALAWVPDKSPQLCLALCDPLDHSPTGSSVHGVLQARMLEWVAIPSLGESSPPRD